MIRAEVGKSRQLWMKSRIAVGAMVGRLGEFFG
jgi:hypothetical protein